MLNLHFMTRSRQCPWCHYTVSSSQLTLIFIRPVVFVAFACVCSWACLRHIYGYVVFNACITIKCKYMLFQESVTNSKAQSHSIAELLRTETNRRALIISTTLLALTQLCGVTVVLFYLEPILKTTRSVIPSSVAALAGAASMFIAGLASLPIIKKFGYIKPLIYSAVGSGVSMVSLNPL